MSQQPQRHNNDRRPSYLDEYVPVWKRIVELREQHPDARIVTQPLDGDPLVFRCEIYLPANESTIPNAVGHASAKGGNGNRGASGSAWEKTETAAIGRALCALGYPSKDDDDAPSSAPRAVPQSAPPARETQRPKPAPVTAATTAPDSAAHAERTAEMRAALDIDYGDDPNLEEHLALDGRIMGAWVALGRKPLVLHTWIKSEFKVTDGLASLSVPVKEKCLQTLQGQAAKKVG